MRKEETFVFLEDILSFASGPRCASDALFASRDDCVTHWWLEHNRMSTNTNTDTITNTDTDTNTDMNINTNTHWQTDPTRFLQLGI